MRMSINNGIMFRGNRTTRPRKFGKLESFEAGVIVSFKSRIFGEVWFFLLS